jgi:hypothetical protein
MVANCADRKVRLTGFSIAYGLPRERQAWPRDLPLDR